MLWQEIAKAASQIHKTIAPMTEIMNQLSAIESIAQKKAGNPLEAEILKTLAMPKPMSLTRLSQLVGREKLTVAAEMRELAKKGLVEIRGWGNGISYSLSPT